MRAHAEKIMANSSNQGSPQRARWNLRRPKEWKIFKPIVSEYRELRRLGAWSTPMSEQECPDLHRIVNELAGRAGIAKPELCWSEWCFISAENAGAFRHHLKRLQLIQYIEDRELDRIATMRETDRVYLAINGKQYAVEKLASRLNMFEKTTYDNASATRLSRNRSRISFSSGFVENCASEAECRETVAHELGHIKKKHIKVSPRIFKGNAGQLRTFEHWAQLAPLPALALLAMHVLPGAEALAAGIGCGVWLGAFMSFRIMKNVQSRWKEREALKFSVEMNGRIMDTVRQKHERIKNDPKGVEFWNLIDGPLSRFLLDGQIYMVLRAVFPDRLKTSRRILSTAPNFDAFAGELERKGIAKYIDEEMAGKVRAIKVGDWVVLKLGKKDYAMEIADGKLNLYERTFWNMADRKIGKYLIIGYDNAGSTRFERMMGRLVHYMFADHPSWKKQVQIIEKAERKYEKEHPGWKPPEQANAVL